MIRVATLAPVLALAACAAAAPVPTVIVAPPPVAPKAAAAATLTVALPDVNVDSTDGASFVTGNAPPVATAAPRPARHSAPLSKDWSCLFPPEADVDDVDDAIVTMEITVDVKGNVARVQDVSDPGHGFGEAATKCVRSQSFVPAADAQGQPATDTFPVKIRFTRPSP
jgi:periplasmic protein TonB